MPETSQPVARIPVDRQRLIPGQPLPGNLYDHTGRLLFQAGQTLDNSAMRMLEMCNETGIFGDEQWQSPPAQAAGSPAPMPEHPEEIAKLRRCGKAGQLRTCPRYSWQSRIPVVLEESTAGKARRRPALVRTLDISSGGFAFEFDQYIHPGTIVHVALRALGRNPLRRGVVRACVHINGRKHRVGVEFCAPPATNPPPEGAPPAAAPAETPAAADQGLSGQPAATGSSGSLTPPVCPAG